MSDAYYRERAARRARMYWMIGILTAIVICIVTGILRIFRDECTGSFTRQPEAVIASYIEAIQTGDPFGPRRCWVDAEYFSLETGCSEICIERILGTRYEIAEIATSQPIQTTSGRGRITASVTVVCPVSGEQHKGEIILDSIGQALPWRHWKIIMSEFGGPMSALWCQ